MIAIIATIAIATVNVMAIIAIISVIAMIVHFAPDIRSIPHRHQVPFEGLTSLRGSPIGDSFLQEAVDAL